MQTPASIARHPIHPMLITLPIGLWVFSLVCDLIFRFGGGEDNWRIVAYYTLAGGIVGALLAAIPGIIDMLSLPPKARRLAVIHMSLNLGVVVLYLINFWMRNRGVESNAPFWLSVVSIIVLAFSGWLGGRLVHVHGVAVTIPPEPVQATQWSPERRHAERRISV